MGVLPESWNRVSRKSPGDPGKMSFHREMTLGDCSLSAQGADCRWVGHCFYLFKQAFAVGRGRNRLTFQKNNIQVHACMFN